MGFIKCMAGHAASLSEEVKEAVIEHGPEKAFEKIPMKKIWKHMAKYFLRVKKTLRQR